MIPEDEIRKRAEKLGLGHLTDIEMEYIRAALIYDYYALEPQMPVGIVFDRGHAYRALKAAVDEERVRKVEWLVGRLWYTEGEE